MKNIFQKIIDNEAPSEKVFENERILAFKDIHPQAPVHILIIPKKAIPNLISVSKEDAPLIAEIIQVANDLAKKYQVEDGFRLVTNNGSDAGQLVDHLHFHLIGGKKLGKIA